jgi:hypothetical protein
MECTVDSIGENSVWYDAKKGLYWEGSYNEIRASEPSCYFFDIKIPVIEGRLDNIEVKIGYSYSPGATIQWALRPYKNTFYNPTGQSGSSGYYSSFGDVDKYVTHSANVSDDLQVARGTVDFPEFVIEAPSYKSSFVKQIIPGNVVKQGQWYTFILWGKPSVDYISIDQLEIFATANYYSGMTQIDTGSVFDKYFCYVDNGTNWDMVMLYVDNGTSWDLYT